MPLSTKQHLGTLPKYAVRVVFLNLTLECITMLPNISQALLSYVPPKLHRSYLLLAQARPSAM